MRTAHRIASILLALLGLIHAGFAPFSFQRFGLNALWFTGSGAALVFAAFLNLTFCESRTRLSRSFTITANLIVLALFAGALAMMRQPQVFAGLGLSAFLSIAAVMPERRRESDPVV